jgi:single-stranded DNA-binding protein
MSLNNVTIDGFVNYVESGTWEGRDGGEDTMWCSFSLSHSARVGRNDDGTPKYSNNYFRVKAKGKLAEMAVDYLDGPGRHVLVQGYLQQRSFGEGDAKRSVVEIMATDIVRFDHIKTFSDGDRAVANDRVPAGVGAGSDFNPDEEPF